MAGTAAERLTIRLDIPGMRPDRDLRRRRVVLVPKDDEVIVLVSEHEHLLRIADPLQQVLEPLPAVQSTNGYELLVVHLVRLLHTRVLPAAALSESRRGGFDVSAGNGNAVWASVPQCPRRRSG